MNADIRLPRMLITRAGRQLPPAPWRAVAGVGLALLAGAGLSFVAIRGSFLYAFGVILLVLAGALLVQKPEIGLLAVTFAIPLEAFNLVGDTPLLSAMKALGVVALGAYAVNYLVVNSHEKLAGPVQNIYIILLLLAMLASDLVAVDPMFAIDKTFKLVRMVSLYFLVINLERTLPALHRILWVMIAAGSVSAVYGYYQYFFLPDTLEDMRINGTMDDPTGFAYALVILLPLVWYMFRHASNRWARLALGGVDLLFLYAVVLSGTRSGMLAAVAVMLLIALREKRPALNMGLIALVVLLGYFFAPAQVRSRLGFNGEADRAAESAQASTDRRFTYYTFGTQLFLERPFLGRGMGGFTETYSHSDYQFYLNDDDMNRVAHNMYLEIATGAGVVGLIPFALLMFSPLVSLERVVRKHPPGSMSDIAKMLQISLAAFLLIGFFSSSQYDKSLWLLIGLTTAAPLIAKAEAKQTPEIGRIEETF